jgi:hypothetical protein
VTKDILQFFQEVDDDFNSTKTPIKLTTTAIRFVSHHHHHHQNDAVVAKWISELAPTDQQMH